MCDIGGQKEKMKKYIVILLSAILMTNLTACSDIVDILVEDESSTEESEAGESNVQKTSADESSVEESNSTEDLEVEDSSQEAPEGFTFSTVDIYGNSYSSDDIKGAKLIMINFWEPWCGPCVSEMPELESLYQNYKEQGLLILGVCYTMEDAKYVIDDNGITYPILCGNDELLQFTTDYVPTTVFINANGNVLTDEPMIGARSYEEWEEEVLQYLAN